MAYIIAVYLALGPVIQAHLDLQAKNTSDHKLPYLRVLMTASPPIIWRSVTATAPVLSVSPLPTGLVNHVYVTGQIRF